MHPKLQEYTKLAQFLAKMLGPAYEVVLNDLHNPENAIVHISNGHISGRKQDGALSQFALKLWYNKAYQDQDYIANYQSHTKTQRLIRSSTFFIKDDESQELLGMLCINYDNSRYQELARALVSLGHPHGFLEQKVVNDHDLVEIEPKDRFAENTHDVINEIINEKLRSQGLNVLDLSYEMRRKWILQVSFEEKLDMVQKMKDRGVFLLKGAVADVAQELHCSQPSIYRYLSKTNQIAFDKNHQKE